MHESTREKALSALDGMREIVRREMLVQGEYVEQYVSEPKFTNALCGGRKHCAIGSLWVGGGVRYERDDFGDVSLPGVLEGFRDDFLRPRHGLRAAYDALNTAAWAFADRHGLDLAEMEHDAAIEALFEGWYGNGLTKRDLLAVIAAAKRIVRKA